MINITNELKEKIDSLSIFDKHSIYMEYYIPNITYNKDFDILFKNFKVDSTGKIQHISFWNFGYSDRLNLRIKGIKNPKDLDLKNVYICYNDIYCNGKFVPPIRIMTFEDFIKEENYKVQDLGKDWAINGFAQRYITHISGIYSYIHKKPELIGYKYN